MSLALVVRCDSDPAPYAGGSSWPCRAYLPTSTVDLGEALTAALRAGWSYEYHREGDRVVTDRVTCPACTRAVEHLARAAERPQEATT